MDDTPTISRTIAQQVRSLRAERGWSLDELASRSGVSRSAISLIERAESSPTAVVLDRLAAALGVALTVLVSPARAESPLTRRAEQPLWVDPATGYRRRTVAATGARMVEIEFPAGATVAFAAPPRPVPYGQHVWVLTGTLELTVGDTAHRLERGDRLTFVVDLPVTFHNPGDRAVRYVVVQFDPGGG